MNVVMIHSNSPACLRSAGPSSRPQTSIAGDCSLREEQDHMKISVRYLNTAAPNLFNSDLEQTTNIPF
jgi:hypothetical protein